MNVPLVSVCFVTYNHEPYVTQALESVLAQSYPSLEIIVGDDGSGDGTYERVLAMAAAHPGRLTVLPQRRNSGLTGIVENYNRVLRACRGEYIAFLEGDDYYLPGKLAAQVQWLEHDASRVLCGHDVEAFDSATGAALYRWGRMFGLSTGDVRRVIEYGVPFSTVSVMLRASAVPAAGFDDRLRVVLDWKFWIDCLRPGGRYGFVPEVLARYRRHPGNVSSKFAAIGQDDQFTTMALLEAGDARLLGACRRGRARLEYMLGLHGAVSEEALVREAARRRLLEAARLAPLRYGKALPALLGSRLAPGLFRRRLVGGAHGPRTTAEE